MNLKQDEIHIWCCHDEKIVDETLLQRYSEILSAAEKEKQRRFHFEKDRHQYLITRALLRNVLSLYTPDVSPDRWQFTNNEHGKPFISAPLLQPLQFNLSHTSGMIVLAITKDQEIGIDVESQSEKRKSSEVADRYFSPTEVAELRALPPSQQIDRFYDVWTLKEAYIKARGMGLAMSLDKFSFAFPNNNSIDIEFSPNMADDVQAWKFWLFEVEKKYKVALAIKSNILRDLFDISVRAITPTQNFNLINWPRFKSSYIF